MTCSYGDNRKEPDGSIWHYHCPLEDGHVNTGQVQHNLVKKYELVSAEKVLPPPQKKVEEPSPKPSPTTSSENASAA